MAATTDRKYAYSTLITRASYLAGVIILAHTLKKHGSKYPLIVFYTSTLSPQAIRALELEAPKSNFILRECDPLLPPVKVTLIAERFTDTWTKLRVFDLPEYDTVCYLDADTAIFNKNMDEVFEKVVDLPKDCIAANHCCVCNLEHDPWAPKDWIPENCAYTPLSHSTALTRPSSMSAGSRPTHQLFNAGLFIYRPSHELMDDILHTFTTSTKLPSYMFPDQDFLADYFRGRMRSLGWQYNAIKTWRYWHRNIWRDEEVVCLHYIVDKPWVKRVSKDGIAGYKGNDGVTHQWWWEAFSDWETQRLGGWEEDSLEAVGLVRRFVAPLEGRKHCWEGNQDMMAIGSGVQAFEKNEIPSVNGQI